MQPQQSPRRDTAHKRERPLYEPRRPRPHRLAIAFALIIAGIVGSILNGTLGGNTRGTGRAPATPVAHGPVASTETQTIDDLRVRPFQIAMGPHHTTRLYITFSNAGASPVTINRGDLSLRVGGATVAPAPTSTGLARPVVLHHAHDYVTALLRFDHAPAPGATLVYAPSWARGYQLRWKVWQ